MPQSGRPSPWPSGTLLAGMNDSTRAELLRLGVQCSYPPGRVLIRQGDVGSSVYLLLNAVVTITRRAENGSEALLGIRVTGDVVGEMSVLDGARRFATVITCGPTVASQIKGPVFLEFLRRHTVVGLTLTRVTSDRLRWANRRRMDTAGYEVAVRLARVLLDLARIHGRDCDVGIDIGVRLSQLELASLISAKEVTVQKAFRELSASGLVQTRPRRVIILDPVRLQEFAGVDCDFTH